MGAAFLGSCYASVDDARQAHCTQSFPVSGSDSGGAFVLSCQAPTTTGLNLVRSDAAGAGSPFGITTAYAECSTTSVASAVITPELAQQAWQFGFNGVLICYLFAVAAGAVLNAIDDRRH